MGYLNFYRSGLFGLKSVSFASFPHIKRPPMTFGTGMCRLHGVCKDNPLAPVIGKLRLPLYRTCGENSVLYDHDLERYAILLRCTMVDLGDITPREQHVASSTRIC